MRRLGGIGILAVALAAASMPAEPVRSAPTPTARLGDPFVDAFNRGDFDAIGTLYAEDAVVFPPQSAPLQGRLAIEAFWKSTRNLGIQSMQRNVLSSDSVGDLAIETGREVLRVQSVGSAEALVHLKYMLIGKKQKDGAWKISREIWNSTPAPAPATTTPATPSVH